MDAALEERAEDRVEGLVGLAEVHPRAAVAQILQAGPARGPRPERLADGIVAPGLVGLHLREPLPGSPDASGEQVAWDPEVTVADAPVARVVTPVEVLDSHVAMLDDAVAMSPEERPDLPRRRGHHEREGVVLHHPRASIGAPVLSSGALTDHGAAF